MTVNFAEWLKDPAAIRVVLVDVNVNRAGLETTLYLSNRDFVTKPTDIPANTPYEPVLTTGINFTEQLDIEGQGNISFGDIEISNSNGELDTWFDDIFDNREVTVRFGDARWAKADFQIIFKGDVAALGSKSRDKLNLSIVDKLQRLNTAMTDEKIGGTGPDKDNVLVLSFGEVSNITPKLTNASTLEYQVHNTAVEGIFEVRDEGKRVEFTANNATGRFTLARQSAGAITASVQGAKPSGVYTNTVAGLIKHIVTTYGKSETRFTTADLDTVNLDAFDATNAQPVGVFADGANVLETCHQLANSVGAQLVMSRLGQLRLIKLDITGTGTPVAIGPDDIVEKSLRVSKRPFVKAAVTLSFDRNWTKQEGLLSSIPEEHKKLFADDWLTATVSDAVVKAKYKLNVVTEQEDTLLCKRTDAEAEANRRLALWKVPRTVFEFEGKADLLADLELGRAVTLTNQRFGLANGKSGVVISLSPQWFTGRVTVGVLV